MARADIDFGVSGNSLVVTIVDDLHLTFDVGFTSDDLAVRFENTVPLESDPLQRPIAPSPSSVLGGSLPSTSEVVQQYFGGDIVFSYNYSRAHHGFRRGHLYPAGGHLHREAIWFNGGGVLPSAPPTAIMNSKVGGPVLQVSTAVPCRSQVPRLCWLSGGWFCCFADAA